jgi:hypothetical protein
VLKAVWTLCIRGKCPDPAGIEPRPSSQQVAIIPIDISRVLEADVMGTNVKCRPQQKGRDDTRPHEPSGGGGSFTKLKVKKM